MDVLITVLQIIALAAMGIGVILIEDTGLQIFLIGAFVLAFMIAVEARRSA